MTDQPPANANRSPNANPANPSERRNDPQELARRVAERVWELWREELRRQNERKGGGTRR